jgi:hypothetical protein
LRSVYWLTTCNLSFKTTTDATQKKAIANTLVREMAVHGDAEYARLLIFMQLVVYNLHLCREISVYNAYKRLGLGDAEQHNKG